MAPPTPQLLLPSPAWVLSAARLIAAPTLASGPAGPAAAKMAGTVVKNTISEVSLALGLIGPGSVGKSVLEHLRVQVCGPAPKGKPLKPI